ncbi:MAG: hypothetical protein MUO82_04650 [Candidatus Thermoplasmatota archaeon]|nr:hypothetical protein [Candidatus Thermoplasmatota archaeon]
MDYYIESDWKVIVVNWSVLNLSVLSKIEQHNITFEITIPPDEDSYTTRYYYDEVADRNLRFPIEYSNLGNWNFSFYKSID